ncbi:MAG: IS30 family transposase [Planctomycetes bacterium]|nr:IS30 family transposase [Planctomycetota bacterium]
MNRYRQLTSEERHTLSTLRRQGYRPAAIARALGRHRSTISREVRRNSKDRGGRVYRPDLADDFARWRRGRSRRNRQFGWEQWELVAKCLEKQWSPEQITGRFKRDGLLSISHETIYRYVWDDRRRGGTLYRHLRCSAKQRRKGYGKYDSRGRLAGKRSISERPAGARNRSRVGHLEGDTVIGNISDKHCVLTLVDRMTGYVMIGKLESRTVEATNRRAVALIKTTRRPVRTVTVDNGTEFHGYKTIEAATGSRFYFATPYHSWERGTSENTNGLIRQYLPKRRSMTHITQRHCNRIAHKLNSRPRKRLGFLTPEECYEQKL